MDFNIIGTNICNVCISIMKTAVTVFGMSYGAINVLLFIIIQPLSIILFAIAAILYANFKKSTSKVKRIIAHCMFTAGVLLCAFEAISLIIVGMYWYYHPMILTIK